MCFLKQKLVTRLDAWKEPEINHFPYHVKSIKGCSCRTTDPATEGEHNQFHFRQERKEVDIYIPVMHHAIDAVHDDWGEERDIVCFFGGYRHRGNLYSAFTLTCGK